MRKIERVVKNLSKYMLLYTLLIIILGILVSYTYSPKFLSKYLMIIVFLMIYPMMVNISFEGLKKSKHLIRPLRSHYLLTLLPHHFYTGSFAQCSMFPQT